MSIDKKLDEIFGDYLKCSDICEECTDKYPERIKEIKQLFQELIDEVIDTNRHDIVECEGKDITEYMNLHRTLQRQRAKELLEKM
jgi:hypothetical protein